MNSATVYAAVQESGADSLITKHASLVKRIAYHLMNRLPNSVLLDDLIQAGMIGLLEAARQYDTQQGASFATYASIRIRGSMLDEVRRSDWTPRSVHKKARTVAAAIRQIENRTGRDARDIEVADLIGLGLNEYHQILRDSIGCRIFSLDELNQDGENYLEDCSEVVSAPIEGLTKSNFKMALADAISGLPERERLVVSFYYEDELNLREIGEVLGVSESRVCQIHSQAMLRLRARMSDWVDNEDDKT